MHMVAELILLNTIIVTVISELLGVFFNKPVTDMEAFKLIPRPVQAGCIESIL